MLKARTVLCIVVGIFASISVNNGAHDWDILIFTQHWPATVCLEWKQKNPSHTCSFPAQKDAWTVHGVWPTKLGTEGPAFCNHSIKFNITSIEPIEDKLEQNWINVEKGTPLNDLWKHEWDKHGTCAIVLSSLNSEPKYFSQGLNWLERYSMSDILLQTNILPNSYSTYKAQNIYDSVKMKLGKNPGVYCRVIGDKSYLFEIRICFDKNLQLIDCNGIVVSESDLRRNLLHCDVNKPVIYLEEAASDVKPCTQSYSHFSEMFDMIELFKLFTWLQWFTF